jgi:creatinine amidohydrolase
MIRSGLRRMRPALPTVVTYVVVILLSVPAAPASGQGAPGAHLGDLTWPEAEARLMDAPLVVIPIGAGAKEHGPHLPMGTDRLMLEHLMQAAVDSLPVLVAPPILHGWFVAFGDFPGTGISDPDVFRRYVQEVAHSLVEAGARRVVFLNTGITHSTGLPVAIAAREIHAHDHVPTLVVSWDDLETPELDSMATQKAGGHADELETSVVLALRPDLVHMERAPTDYGKPTGDPGPGYRPGGFSRTPGDPEYTTTGIFGDATLATAEKGRRVVTVMTHQWLEALRAFATTPLGEG